MRLNCCSTLTLVAITGLAISLTSCAGYRLGASKPKMMENVESLSIPTMRNGTLLPRVEILSTNTLIKQFQQDGTFQIARDEQADAVLLTELSEVSRRSSRSVRDNVRATREFVLTVFVDYQVLDLRTGEPLGGGTVTGSTSFFVGSDVTQEERIAIPRAIEEASVRLVSRLSSGW
ncbi:MAG: LPS assembly lipoprotein LptE [Verrucomicrobiales bacterium]